jgi:hypothetical protein
MWRTAHIAPSAIPAEKTVQVHMRKTRPQSASVLLGRRRRQVEQSKRQQNLIPTKHNHSSLLHKQRPASHKYMSTVGRLLAQCHHENSVIEPASQSNDCQGLVQQLQLQDRLPNSDSSTMVAAAEALPTNHSQPKPHTYGHSKDHATDIANIERKFFLTEVPYQDASRAGSSDAVSVKTGGHCTRGPATVRQRNTKALGGKKRRGICVGSMVHATSKLLESKTQTPKLLHGLKLWNHISQLRQHDQKDRAHTVTDQPKLRPASACPIRRNAILGKTMLQTTNNSDSVGSSAESPAAAAPKHKTPKQRRSRKTSTGKTVRTMRRCQSAAVVGRTRTRRKKKIRHVLTGDTKCHSARNQHHVVSCLSSSPSVATSATVTSSNNAAKPTLAHSFSSRTNLITIPEDRLLQRKDRRRAARASNRQHTDTVQLCSSHRSAPGPDPVLDCESALDMEIQLSTTYHSEHLDDGQRIRLLQETLRKIATADTHFGPTIEKVLQNMSPFLTTPAAAQDAATARARMERFQQAYLQLMQENQMLHEQVQELEKSKREIPTEPRLYRIGDVVTDEELQLTDCQGQQRTKLDIEFDLYSS